MMINRKITSRRKIPEIRYRASRICRALGNPTAYEILHILTKHKQTPEQLAHALGISVATVSQTLRVLRLLDLVRYEVSWRKHTYWIKTQDLITVMENLEELIKTIKGVK